MLRAEATNWNSFAGASLDGDNIALPLGASQGRGQGGFSVLMQSVAQEVNDYIVNGDSTSSLPSQTAAWQPGLTGAVDVASTGVAQERGTHPDAATFMASLQPGLGEAARTLGVSEEIIAAHAALESNWGRQPVRARDGRSTFNLFGIKAGGNWQGNVAEAQTTEVVDGNPVRIVDRFRSYADGSDAFRDYSRLLRNNSRYHDALNAGNNALAYANGLVKGGYATDPDYARKLAQIASQFKGGR
jgi:flagellar protein FlgJ